MTGDETSERLRARIDHVAPPISLSELDFRSVRRMGIRSRPLLVAASLIVLIGLAAMAIVFSAADGEQDVLAGESSTTDDGASSSTTADVPDEGAGWPEVLSATAQKPEVVVSSLATGEVTDRFAPPDLADGGLTGATGAPDGRIAAWSGAEIAVRADGVTYERALVDAAEEATITGSIRVLFVPAAPVVWIVASTGAQAQVLQWDYIRDELSPADVDLPRGSLPAGVGDDGQLVLNSADPYAFNTEEGTPMATIVGPALSGPPLTFEGSVLAVGGDAALIGRCGDEAPCSLVAIDLASGEAAEIAVGDVDPTAVRSLIGPTVPSETAPLPTGDPGSGRVLVGVEVGPQVPQDQPTTLAIVDLDGLRLELPEGAPMNVLAATWSCDGSNIAGLGADGTWRSLSGDGTAGALPDGTFLYGLGQC